MSASNSCQAGSLQLGFSRLSNASREAEQAVTAPLSDTERARLEAIGNPRKRREYLLSRGLVAFAIFSGVLGIDLEAIDPGRDFGSPAEAFMNSEELAELPADGAARTRYFYRLWCARGRLTNRDRIPCSTIRASRASLVPIDARTWRGAT